VQVVHDRNWTSAISMKAMGPGGGRGDTRLRWRACAVFQKERTAYEVTRRGWTRQPRDHFFLLRPNGQNASRVVALQQAIAEARALIPAHEPARSCISHPSRISGHEGGPRGRTKTRPPKSARVLRLHRARAQFDRAVPTWSEAVARKPRVICVACVLLLASRSRSSARPGSPDAMTICALVVILDPRRRESST
jgi:hypothetical protein